MTSSRWLIWLSKPINPDRLKAELKQALEQLPANHPRILHVEDDDGILQLVKGIIGDVANLDQAVSLAEAKRLLSQRAGTIW